MSPETCYKILLLMLSRDSVAMGFWLADFIQASHNMPGQPKRIATVALVFSTAGLLTKTAD
jgi:hypothetical protein